MKTISSNRGGGKRLSERILRRVRAQGRGTVFSARDFSDLGSPNAVRQTLSRLVKRGKIRRVRRGLYDLPRTVRLNGAPMFIAPDATDVATALARQSGARLQMAPAQAANALGLSTQVPAQTTFLTSGPSRRVRVGKQTLSFKHASRRMLAGAGQKSGLVVSALRYLGARDVHDEDIARLQSLLNARDKAQLQRVARDTFVWMRPILSRIARS